jgi:hypothetical protein
MNRISRKDRFNGLSDIDKKLESIESLNELILLYRAKIQSDLDNVTSNKTLQDQIRYELGIL